MDRHRNAGTGDKVGEHDQVILVRMHAARRREPHQMASAAGLLQRGQKLGQRRIPGERSVLDGVVDPWQVRHGDAAGAKIHVADLGVAHLALGQPDEGLRRVDQALRAGRDQPVVVGRAGIENGIVLGVRAMAPAVEDAEDSRPRTLGSGHQPALPARGRSRSTALNLLGQLRSRGSVLGFWSGTSMAQNTNSPRGSPSMLMS